MGETQRTNRLLIAAVWAGACSENLDPKTPDGALHAFRDASRAATMNLWWILFKADPRRAEIVSGAHMVQQAEGFKRYPPEYRIGALGIYPRRVLEAKTPASLLSCLYVRLNQYPPSAGTRFGLSTAATPIVANGGASIMTHSGETYYIQGRRELVYDRVRTNSSTKPRASPKRTKRDPR